MNNKIKNVNKILIVIYVVTLLYSFYNAFTTNNNSAIGMSFVAILCPFLTPIVFKILKWKMVDEVMCVNIIFMYFASLIGSCLGGYSTSWFDKVVHFSSGFLACLIGVIIYYYIRKEKKARDNSDFILLVIFMNCFNMAVALLWEFYEFMVLVLFNNDAIRHYTTGVYDSMSDMLLATISGLALTFIYYRYYKNNKNNFLINIYESFYEANIAPKIENKD